MEWSATKNVVISSHKQLAKHVGAALPNLQLCCGQRARSLGGALGAGKVRNAKVQRERLAAFIGRKANFRRMRRAVGARRANLVLRTGGVAGLTYGQANTG
eukprot:3669610-Karenia_brevis.AAC.1